jgi:replication factor C subunit 1
MLLIVIFGVRLFGFSGGKLRMDERIDLSMSDPDLVPLLIQVFFLIFFLNSMRILDSEGGY